MAEAGRWSDRALRTWLVVGILAALAVCYALSTQTLVLGSNAGGWVYRYVEPFNARILIVSLFEATLCGVLVAVVEVDGSRRDWLVLLGWIGVATALDALVRTLTPFTFEQIFQSEGANSFYGVTTRVPALSVLSDFDRLRHSWPLHAQSNMPGKLIFVYLLRVLTTTPNGLAWCAVVVSNVGALAMYAVVRELFGDARTALYAAILYLVVPARIYFFPLLNTVTPVFVLGCALLVLLALRTGRTGYAAALGVSVFALAFFEPLPLAMGLLFVLFVLRAVELGCVSWRRVFALTGVALGTCVATYAAVRLAFGFDLVKAFFQVGGHALQFNEDVDRPYAVWVLGNLRDFFFGAGVCQAIVFCAISIESIRMAGSWRRAVTRPATLVSAGLAAMLIAIDGIGINRGEVIRLWIFLAAFFQIPTAYACARLRTPLAVAVVLAVTLLQASLGTAMVGFILP